MFKNTEGSLNVHNAGNFVDENKHLTSTFSNTLDLLSSGQQDTYVSVEAPNRIRNCCIL